MAAGCAPGGALLLSLGALDGRTAAFAVWGLLGAGCAAGAAYGPAARAVRAAAAVGAVGYAAGLLVAAAALTDLAVAWWGLPVLAVPAAVAALGPRLGAVRIPAEVAAGAAGILAPALALTRPGALAAALSLAGVVCAGAAVRPDRRGLGLAAGALFATAAWVRLAMDGVTTPEAYALPVTVPALAVGLLRRRRDPEGPGGLVLDRVRAGSGGDAAAEPAGGLGRPALAAPAAAGPGGAGADPGGCPERASGTAAAGRGGAGVGGAARAGPVRGAGGGRPAALAAAGPGGPAAAGGGGHVRRGWPTRGDCGRRSAGCGDGGANARGPETVTASGPLVRVGDTGFEPVTPSV